MKTIQKIVSVQKFFVIGMMVITSLVFTGSAEARPSSTNYNPRIVPSEFSTKITNPYFTLNVGQEMVYEGQTEDGLERIEIEITGETKTVMGVETLVYRDRVYVGGKLVEDTKDYLAQDTAGNVWYFGEDVNNLENEKVVDHEGSWLAGVDGAAPGIWMKAHPVVNEEYLQEYYKGEAEDWARVLSLTEKVTVPYGIFTDCLKTQDVNPFDPKVVEYKYYCKGEAHGFVLEENTEDNERIQMISQEINNDEGELPIVGVPTITEGVAKATATSLYKGSGMYINTELEMEKGVLVYAIEFRESDGNEVDVKINAHTGALVVMESDKDEKSYKESDEKDTTITNQKDTTTKVEPHKVCHVFKEKLRKGARDGQNASEIATLQAFMNQNGYESGAPDGVFGMRTHTAIQAFQRAMNLFSDGIVGPRTQEMLNRSCK